MLQERRKVAAILLEYTCSVLYGHPTIRVFEYSSIRVFEYVLTARCASNILAFADTWSILYTKYNIHISYIIWISK